ncbi:uncharacterized protein N7503_000574 [Penicillium pulvis]|uniref:uncharacterized protein n=1 Tax=Penicillium pulvis TaxID=1562058 RepID=UPI002546DC4B|nr:uncharacterized protein N7503_000574 [Penicillium pulvis]KAJ5813824.1 hypothetical protein N7503_000574 [Penicillium pulvis]
MSEIMRKVEKVVHGHQYETDDTGQGDLHDSDLANKLDPRVRTENGDAHSPQPTTVSRGVQTSGSIMTDGSTGAETTDDANQDDQNDYSGEDCNTQNKSDARPVRPIKQDTLVGC